MELPSDIKKRILDYLHLEYGEDPASTSSLKLEDIEYDGLYEIAGTPIHYFRYAPEGKRRWATVEPYGDSYIIGMTSKTPTPVSKKQIYNQLTIQSLDDEYSESISLEDWGNGCFGLPDYKKVNLPNGSELLVLAEAQIENSPPSVTIGIQEGDNELYIRGSLGLSMSYKSNSGSYLVFTVGTGPWE